MSITATAVMNIVIQFVMYPFLERGLGKEAYGVTLSILSIVAILAGTIGTAANYSRMVTSTHTQRVKIGVEQNFNTQLLVFAQEIPKDGEQCGNTANCCNEPNGADTAAESHTYKNEHENQRNAQVTGQYHVCAGQKTQMQHHGKHGAHRGNAVLER